MRGNPTAGIILLLGSALLIGFGGKYQDRLKGAWTSLKGSPATTTTTTTTSNPTNSPKTIQKVIDNSKKNNTTSTPTTSWGGVSV